MITIRFRSKDLKDKAIACLAGKARFRDSMPGALLVSDEAFDLLKERRIPFISSFAETTPDQKRVQLMSHSEIFMTAVVG